MPNDNNLHKAANRGDLEECQRWIETPPDGEDPCGVNDLGANDRTALHRAAGGGHIAVAEYLIAKGANIDVKDKSGRSPLMWAAIAGAVEVMQLLVTKGADIKTVTTSNTNILHAACEANKPTVVTFILDYCKDKEALRIDLTGMKNNDGKMPSQIATDAKNETILNALKNGGDTNVSGACIIS